MKSYRIHIPHAKLIRSEKPTAKSQNMCTSVYKISGEHAHIAETLIIRRYGMHKLVFECCVWSPENGQAGYFRRSHPMASGAHASYTISMHSDETLQKQWNKIENFYITLAIDAI